MLITRYPSLGAFIDVASGASEMADNARPSRRMGPDLVPFFGGYTFDEAVSLARRGDIAGASIIRAETMKTASDTFRIKTARFDPVYRNDGGCQVDVGRYLSGEPECWADFVPVIESPRVGVDVVLNIGAHWKIGAGQIASKASQIAGAVLGLQAAGYLVNVHIAKHWGGKRRDTESRTFAFPLNPGGTPLNVALLVAVLQPYFFRRVVFSMYETLDAKIRKAFNVGVTNGSSLPLSVNQARDIAGTTGRVVVVNVGESIQYGTNEAEKIRGTL